MIAYSPKAVSPRESTVPETNGIDDVDWVGVVLGDLENNFRHGFQLFEEFPLLCSEGAGEMGRLNQNFDCLAFCELSFVISVRARDNKR